METFLATDETEKYMDVCVFWPQLSSVEQRMEWTRYILYSYKVTGSLTSCCFVVMLLRLRMQLYYVDATQYHHA